jgi:27-O-demethylrifamycin SV methyltransferase
MTRAPVDRPDIHYDRISNAWRYLMGESFHYGYFDAPGVSLDDATDALSLRMARVGDVQAGHRVLDVGCGIGGPGLLLAERVGCRVLGISTSDVGIRTARERAAERGLEALATFEVRDGMDHGLGDRSFDRVWIMESSHLMSDKGALIREAARVLVPGGRLVLCDIIMHRELPFSEVMKRAKAFDLLRVVFGRAKMATLSAYRAWCEESGLTVSCCDDISREAAPTFSHWKQNADRHRDDVVRVAGEAALADFSRACDELEVMWEDEVLGYGMVAADKLT